MTWISVLRCAAYFLLCLSGLSSLVLFIRAAFCSKDHTDSRAEALWGLFVLAGAGGIAIAAAIRF